MANANQSHSAALLEGMQGVLTFVVGVAAMAFHVWTTIIIYNIWGFKLAFPAFILPVFAEIAVLCAEWQRTHVLLSHYSACFAVVVLGFVIQSLIGRLLGRLGARG